MSDPKKILDLDGSKAVLYMLFALEAKMNMQTSLLIEMAEIITQKDPGVIKMEVLHKTINELKKVREKFIESDELLDMINNIKL